MKIDQTAYKAWDDSTENSRQDCEGLAFKKLLHDELKKKLDEELAEIKDINNPDKPVPESMMKKDKKNKVEAVQQHDHGNVGGEHLALLKEIKIADITFAYDNRIVIQLLQQRGAAIARKDYNKMREFDAKLAAYLEDDNHVEQCRQPQVAFITFEEEEAYLLAMHIEEEQASGKENWKILELEG